MFDATTEPTPAKLVDIATRLRDVPLGNDARLEWLMLALDGHPAGLQKRLVMYARSTEIGFIDDQQASVLMGALGLGPA